jgi:hypothetical protein
MGVDVSEMPPPFALRAERRDERSRVDLVRRVSGEFFEMPCLRLTRPQARRLFGLRADICDRVLAELIRDGVLTIGDDDRYRLSRDTWIARATLGSHPSIME